MSSGNRIPEKRSRDPDMAGAEAALRRAAKHARRRAEEAKAAGEAKRRRDISDGSWEIESRPDSRTLSFSQAQGYEEIPGPLNLAELPTEARTRIWNLFHGYLSEFFTYGPEYDGERRFVGRPWDDILYSMHRELEHGAVDDWDPSSDVIRCVLRHSIETLPFNKVFDLIQFVLRHRACPRRFVADMTLEFAQCRLAYTIDEGPPPTIVPAATPEEGRAVVEALRTLRESGMVGAAAHLRKASECIKAGDWAGSVRESIHAVESVARLLDPAASATLGPALKALKKDGLLHPALEGSFKKLYGYTSNEQGIRHALLDRADSNVGMDEALFMLSACASFASFLRRKHTARQAP